LSGGKPDLPTRERGHQKNVSSRKNEGGGVAVQEAELGEGKGFEDVVADSSQ
jgi:hypothetical protein